MTVDLPPRARQAPAAHARPSRVPTAGNGQAPSRSIDRSPAAPVAGTTTMATARRVLAQLRGDRRTVVMLLVVPGALLALIHQMFDSQPDFNRTALSLLGIFPFTMMFIVTSVAMLRERSGGTLERLLTTPISKLELLLGYGIAFALAAAVQAALTCAVAYRVLGLYTPGNPVLVVAIAVVSAAMGMSLGLLASAFARSEFQAVQFMPAFVIPQMLLGGLFVPREHMADWAYAFSSAMPLTYDIDALAEVGKTSLITATLVGDTAVMIGVTGLALVLAAATLRRSAGPLPRVARRARLIAVCAALSLCAAAGVGWGLYTARYIRTDNALVDGDQITVTAPATGILVGWQGSEGTSVHRNQVLGHMLAAEGFPRAQTVIRAPADGTIALNDGVNGTFLTAGSRLAVAYDLARAYVTARIKEIDIADVRVGRPVELSVDAYPGEAVSGQVVEIQSATAAATASTRLDNTTGVFQKPQQWVPVRITVPNDPARPLLPGMNVTVTMRRAPLGSPGA